MRCATASATTEILAAVLDVSVSCLWEFKHQGVNRFVTFQLLVSVTNQVPLRRSVTSVARSRAGSDDGAVLVLKTKSAPKGGNYGR